jgi:hypothetical protein
MSYNSGAEVLLNEGLHNRSKKAGYITPNDDGAGILDVAVNSISFSNVSTVELSLIIDGNNSPLPPGSSVSFDAGGNQNLFPANTFEWDSTGGMLLIAYTW